MDELMDRRLRAQEQSLRAVMGVFGQVERRMAALGSGTGWAGPASAAYDVAVVTLRTELYAVEVQLGAALRDTVDAISAVSPGAQESCGR
jgi:hypothetical protein